MDVEMNEEVVEEGIVEQTAVQSETVQNEEYELRTVETVMESVTESVTSVKEDTDSDVPPLENVK